MSDEVELKDTVEEAKKAAAEMSEEDIRDHLENELKKAINLARGFRSACVASDTSLGCTVLALQIIIREASAAYPVEWEECWKQTSEDFKIVVREE